MTTQNATACLIMIGNELLSGRTQDKNLPAVAKALNEVGVRLTEARVIPDIVEVIAETVNHYRSRFTYVFTSGGIGPTHDDITTASVAKAFGVPVLRHPEAEKLLRAHYTEEMINDARLKMADIPQGATLIPNPISAAPGFILENVFVMAGVPSICAAMLDEIKPLLKGGKPMKTESMEVDRPEGDLAAGITAVQDQFSDVEIGVYPLIKHGKLMSNIVLRCDDDARLTAATTAMRSFIAGFGATATAV
jgi:molybdenum cofactor synthesis domain-containing protein